MPTLKRRLIDLAMKLSFKYQIPIDYIEGVSSFKIAKRSQIYFQEVLAKKDEYYYNELFNNNLSKINYTKKSITFTCKFGYSFHLLPIFIDYPKFSVILIGPKNKNFDYQKSMITSAIKKEINLFTKTKNRKLNPIIYNFLDKEDLYFHTLSQWSHELVYDRASLSKKYKEITGQTFQTKQKEMKILAAKNYLLLTNLKNKEIAQIIGCKNQSHFSDYFKNAVGVPPSNYRLIHT
ncbi:MAG: helix-turn-helix transcriptional regulator [Streptococcaceae bacterium]|jgi:YesN/AraC family two-component response regulator|nr:helix-turn-helix transcriptional regulator [Streptococcaceae bacterium]